MPALVYVAGAIGSQAVSVAMRGLSTENISIGRLLQDGIIIGLPIGLTLGSVTFVFVFVFFDKVALSLAVGLVVPEAGRSRARYALFAACGPSLHPWPQPEKDFVNAIENPEYRRPLRGAA